MARYLCQPILWIGRRMTSNAHTRPITQYKLRYVRSMKEIGVSPNPFLKFHSRMQGAKNYVTSQSESCPEEKSVKPQPKQQKSPS